MIDGNNAAAIDFLLDFHDEGPYTLIAIGVDRTGIWGRTFRDEDGIDEWLTDHNGQHNIYFHVNQLMDVIHKKGELRDIADVGWLHVDVDPEIGDLATQQADCLSRLQAHEPPPTCIIFSGGGYQGFWKLDERILIKGIIEDAHEAGRYNQQIQITLNADNCHNIDRIMRLPGTVNIPDQKKRDKGRIEALAEVVEWNKSRVYSLDAFIKAPAQQTRAAGAFAGNTVDISANVERIHSIDLLEVPHDLKVVIAQGGDPTNRDRWESRSEALFYVVCQMLKAGIAEDLVYSIITDPRFDISSSVLDKGLRHDRYALRQIEKAREYVVAPELAELNAKHAVIEDMGGKCVVVSELYNEPLGRYGLSKQTFGAFKDRYGNRLVSIGKDDKGNKRWMPLGRWWLSQKMRRQFEQIVFAPEKQIPNTYNLWRGFACEAIQGNCNLYLAHIRDNVCSGDNACYEYLLNWMARCVQYPATQGRVAVVLRGKMGTGKGLFVKVFGQLFGRHYLYVSDGKHLVGNFNSHLRDAVVIFADEAFFAGDKQHESILKALVTEDTLSVEAKYIDVTAAPNYTHILMASNSDWVVPADAQDRRYFMMDMGEKSMQKPEYFAPMLKQMDDGGQEALLYTLMKRDLKDFNVWDYPKTAALSAQKIMTLSVEVDWWLQILQDGSPTTDATGWHEHVPKDFFYRDYLAYASDLGLKRKLTKSSFYTFMCKMVPSSNLVTVRRRVAWVHTQSDNRFWCYIVPPLNELRDYFVTMFPGVVSEWQHIEDENMVFE